MKKACIMCWQYLPLILSRLYNTYLEDLLYNTLPNFMNSTLDIVHHYVDIKCSN